MTTLRVIGIDPGTANLGVGVLTHDGHECVSLTTHLHTSRPAVGPVATVRRINDIARRALEVAAGERTTCADEACGHTRTEPPADIVVALVEQPVPGKGSAHHGELHALFLHLVRLLDLRGIPVATTHQATLKKWATGSGSANKAAMKLALDRLWPGVMTRSQHDRADAEHPVDGGLAALAAGQWLGWHQLGDPLRQAKSLAVMTWPRLPERIDR